MMVFARCICFSYKTHKTSFFVVAVCCAENTETIPSFCFHQMSAQNYSGQLIYSLGRLNSISLSCVIYTTQVLEARKPEHTSCFFTAFPLLPFFFQHHI